MPDLGERRIQIQSPLRWRGRSERVRAVADPGVSVFCKGRDPLRGIVSDFPWAVGMIDEQSLGS